MCECGFKINQEIAGYKLTAQNLSDIVQFSKTEKIKTFKSNASKNFTASLVIDKESKKLNFEF